MRPVALCRLGIALLLVTVPAIADTRFRISKMKREDAVPLGKAQCEIRIKGANEIEVSIRREFATLTGRGVRDDGSECSEPLPDREIRDFSFDADSRDTVRLVEAPSPRNDWTAVIRIRDAAGGQGRYHFRLTWSEAAASLGRGGPPPGFETPSPLTRNNAMHFTSPGRGGTTFSAGASERLLDATVDIDRAGHIQVSFRTAGGKPITFTGGVIARERETWKADVAAGEALLHLRGSMYLSIDAKENIRSITLEATDGRDHLHLNWEHK